MEQIIIAMIYLYPGALVDILRRAFFKRTYCDEETSDGARTAKHFVYSTIISVVFAVDLWPADWAAGSDV